MQKQHQDKAIHQRKVFGFRIINRFKDAEEGVAAIEFGMLALPFLMLIFAILETAVGFFAAQVFESGVDVVGRRIRTGQISSSGTGAVTATQVRDEICSKTIGLFTCADIKLDVKSYPTFPGAPLGTPTDGGGNLDPSGFGFDTGASGAIVVVRAYYEWPIFLDYLWQNISTGVSNGNRLLIATTAFQNEPF
jgi:Flp pilus assembly protein TadG